MDEVRAPDAIRLLEASGREMRRPDLTFATIEMVGGLFYFNYPGGSGLVSAAVFGRIAGRSSGRHR
jgi:tricarballylate dehydrogenase